MITELSVLLAVSVAAVAHAAADQEAPDNVRSIIEKTQSFGLGRYPISFWSYTNLREHGQYMDEDEVEEWADAGFTVPQSPSYDPSDPAQKAHILQMLDWAHERGIKDEMRGEPQPPQPPRLESDNLPRFAFDEMTPEEEVKENDQ